MGARYTQMKGPCPTFAFTSAKHTLAVMAILRVDISSMNLCMNKTV